MKHLFRLSHEILDSIELEDLEKTYDDMFEMKIANPPFKQYSIEVSSKFLSKLGQKICAYLKNENYWPKEFNFGFFFKFEDYSKEDKETMMPFFKNLKNSANGEVIPEKNRTSLVEMFFIKNDGTVHSWDDYEIYRQLNNINEKITEGYKQRMANIALKIRQILIVMLATKNHVSEQKIDKDIARGRYNKKQAYRKDYPITTTISIGKITETYEGKGGTGSKKRPHMRRGHIRTQHYGPNRELTQKIFIQPVFVNADEGWIAERRAYNVGA